MSYIDSYKDQNWLLPPSIKQMITKNHICFFVEEFVDSLDFSKFDMISEGVGHPSYHPRIIMKVIIQGMLSKERSSRILARACRENFVFMYLAEKVQPNFRTICRFRRQNVGFIKETFKETLNLASENNLVDLSLICTDGSTIKANANKKKCLKRGQIEKLDSIIDKMIEDDIKQDEIDEQLYSKEENLTERDKRDFKKIVSEYKRTKDKKKIKQKIEKVKEELEKDPDMKRVSLIDPESRMMQNKKRYIESSYNAQFSVSKNQIILANDVCQDGQDVNQLQPQVRQVKENVELLKGTKIITDCGYSDGENIMFLEKEGLDGYIPSRAQAQKFDGKEESLNHDNYEYDEKNNELIVDRERFRYRGMYTKNGKKIISFFSDKLKKKKDVPFFFKERLRMRDKMSTKEEQEIYSMRKITVEPVIGNIKENFGFREFKLRGLDGVKLELNLVSIAHNLKKIWMIGRKVRVNCSNQRKNICFWLILDLGNIYCGTASAVMLSDRREDEILVQRSEGKF